MKGEADSSTQDAVIREKWMMSDIELN